MFAAREDAPRSTTCRAVPRRLQVEPTPASSRGRRAEASEPHRGLGTPRLVVAGLVASCLLWACGADGPTGTGDDALRRSSDVVISDVFGRDGNVDATDGLATQDTAVDLELASDDAGDGADTAVAPTDTWAPPTDTGPAPECAGDTDCGDGRGCLAGICRSECVLGMICASEALLGELCVDGLCVDCKKDSDCDARYACDQATYRCVERDIDPSITRFGIFYHTWHCRAAHSTPVHDLSEVQAGRQGYHSNYNTFYWWDEPQPGYYCLSANDALLRQHAALLRDAGMDFVFVDATNHNYVGAGSDDTPGMILAPLDRLLAVWSTVPGAPRVVAWVPVEQATADAARYTVDAFYARLAAYPELAFIYEGKPLLLLTDNQWHPPNEARVAELAAHFTVRRMWAHIDKFPASAGYTAETWSFMETCEAPPSPGQPCRQRIATRAGAPEQVTVSTAYQYDYMSTPAGAVGKLQGLTFRKQFETAFDHPEVPIVTITGWNEWIAQRQPCGIGTCDCATFPDGCFLDTWDVDRSRDIEPAKNAMGDYYYRLLVSCVGLFKRGERCDAAHAGELCCHAYP